MKDITVELMKWNIHVTSLQETGRNWNGLIGKKCMMYFVVQKEMRDDKMVLHLSY